MTPPAAALPPQEGAHLIALFNAGRHAELEARARALSLRYPDAGFVWKVLGTVLLVQHKDGIAALRRAAELLPDDVETLSNLGNAQKAQGRLDEAAASYQQAVRKRPDYVAGHYNLGIVLKDLGRSEEAVARYRQAIALLPGFVEAHYNLGLALQELGRVDEAQASYRQALALKPDYAEAHYNLGIALKAQGRLDDAAEAFGRAVALRRDDADALCNLGTVREAQARHREAESSYRQAIAARPDMAQAHNNLGNVLKDLGRYDEAEASYRQALRHDPGMADAHNNLGNLFKDLGRLDEARACYREALARRPADTDAFSNLLFVGNYLPDEPVETLLAQARAYGELVASLGRPFETWSGSRDPERPLRVGLVSGDLCQHPVGFFIDSVLGALRQNAEGRIQLHAYATHVRSDALTARLQAHCAGWCQAAPLGDDALAERIRADGIDILIDLAGHTAHNRLPVFARKPAPVQVSWLGYFATTGVAAIDWVLADPWTVPDGAQAPFTEGIWRLPETRLCFTPPDAPAVAALPAQSAGRVTFGCFNNLTKVNDGVVALWARVLQAVPTSRLLLKAEQLDDASVRQQLTARLQAHGIDAGRIALQGRSPRAEYLAAYGQIDIALDPFPFTGGTTTVESLWMGVPVLTLAGDRMVARQGVGLLTNAGLPNWVAEDAAAYVAKACAFAADLPALAALRAGLREQALASPLFDAPRFAGHFEAALRGMWRAHCSAPAA